jgi:endoglucanase
VNIHWDNGWFAKFPTDYDGCIKKYTSIWKQISERFQDYGDYLIFESLNEEGGWDSVWNRYSGGTEGKAESYDMLNKINQTFVKTVRASGGNNTKRHLLIAGYNTDFDLTCDPLFKMPTDPEKRCAVSLHYYTPVAFAILDKDASWAKARDTWGTSQDLRELEKYMNKVKAAFIDKGIPIILGEYGVALNNKTEEMARLYLTSVCEAAYIRGMCPMLWATPDVLYDRKNAKIYDKKLAEEFTRIFAIER